MKDDFLKDDLIDQVIGGCRIERLLGRGGMGRVYKAKHINLDIPVALKVLDRHLETSTQELVERFITEARAAARLDSPYIVRVMQVGEENGIYFIQMEFVEGESLANKIKQSAPFPLSTALQFLYQIAMGLNVAHEANIIHRDIKPDNILINNKGVVKIVDFGLAKLLQNTSALTQSGQILGTPYYLSPEQCEGKNTDARSDIYALGITFYQMITADLPFKGDNPLTTIISRLQFDPPSPKILKPDLPAEMESFTLKMIARSPLDRYQNMGEILQEILEQGPQHGFTIPGIGPSETKIVSSHGSKLNITERRVAGMDANMKTEILGNSSPPLPRNTTKIPEHGLPTIIDEQESQKESPSVPSLMVPKSYVMEAKDSSEKAESPLPSLASGDATLLDSPEVSPSILKQERQLRLSPSMAKLESTLSSTLPKKPVQNTLINPSFQKVTEHPGKTTRKKHGWIYGTAVVMILLFAFFGVKIFQKKAEEKAYNEIVQNSENEKVEKDKTVGQIDDFFDKYPKSQYKNVLQNIKDRLLREKNNHQNPKPAGDKPAGDKPAGDKPAGDKPAGDKPAGDKPTGDKPADISKKLQEDKELAKQKLNAFLENGKALNALRWLADFVKEDDKRVQIMQHPDMQKELQKVFKACTDEFQSLIDRKDFPEVRQYIKEVRKLKRFTIAQRLLEQFDKIIRQRLPRMPLRDFKD